ncbi:MAG: hypothetical protein FJ031_02000 [Chloroflexi bacterium]|nr:hypothetical protein [Chloroflexota bacterium]
MMLSERSELDKGLLLFFLSCALTFIFYSLWSEGTNVDGLRAGRILPRMPAVRENIRDNAAGMLLAFFFFLVYFYIGSHINQFVFSHTDNLFDADISSWIKRIADPDAWNLEMRSPHPFTYFIFRPFGWFLYLITQDPSLSARLLNTGAGAAGVFLAWLLIRPLA